MLYFLYTDPALQTFSIQKPAVALFLQLCCGLRSARMPGKHAKMLKPRLQSKEPKDITPATELADRPGESVERESLSSSAAGSGAISKRLNIKKQTGHSVNQPQIQLQYTRENNHDSGNSTISKGKSQAQQHTGSSTLSAKARQKTAASRNSKAESLLTSLTQSSSAGFLKVGVSAVQHTKQSTYLWSFNCGGAR